MSLPSCPGAGYEPIEGHRCASTAGFVEPFNFAAVGNRQPTSRAGVLRAQLPRTSRTLTSIRWLVRAADDLGLYRNVATHTPLLTLDPVRPDDTTGRPSAIARFRKQPPEMIWRRLRGDLMRLAEYAEAIQFHIGGPTGKPPREPLPRRPRLLMIPPQRRKRRLRKRQVPARQP
jgi:hypothetical protein